MHWYNDLEKAMENLSTKGAFLTAKASDGTVNTMTISWGYIGFSWGKPFFVTLVRPSRYTHEILKTADSYTISIPYGKTLRKALGICGSKSGRDVDKAALAGISFLPSKAVDSPIVGGCDIYYECKISYIDTLHTDKLPQALRETSYPDGDYHDLYYGEIVETYHG